MADSSKIKPLALRHPIDNLPELHTALLKWFASEGKTYPWRETTDPWSILVSEIMLQQTQIATVLDRGYYANFLARFPDPISIADADEEEILKAWEGLGYYRRVRNLQNTARQIVTSHDNQFPTDHGQILDLPGVGPYTAGAVASFAFNQPEPIVDGNIARVLSRLFDFHGEVDSSAGQKQIWAWAGQLVHSKKARQWNSAIMELGQTYCSAKNPNCDGCPVWEFCLTRTPDLLPSKKAAKKTVLVDEFTLLCRDQFGRVLMQQQASGARREGFWKLPERDAEAVAHLHSCYRAKYGITHHRVTLYVYQCAPESLPEAAKGTKESWFTVDELEALPISSPYRKALDKLLSDSLML
ncbi:A/G-specific adenine glycosylase [Persicirhabdus sediminis]|uniref:Adenine DNA glycosylase n=1 Tax=Persicirhabdus sediminis TaxID=454144 RepID=A0A8J7MEB9_9BACT|nr:A/G-specific adenine glycosylase [Persicirhabdus sediminis]MBK1791168.1 A/G-specific adenine glycosylase [Persicirhabdus sediminis]